MNGDSQEVREHKEQSSHHIIESRFPSLSDAFHFSVSSSSFESCNDTPARVEAGEGYIAGGLLPGSPASSGRGPGTAAASSSVGCSWVIAAQSGQKINLTMINFDYKGGVAGHRHSYRRRGHAGVACTDVAMVTDGDTKQNIRLCEDQPRETQAYLSTSDSIELQIYNRALPGKTPSEKGLFLLQYKGKRVLCCEIRFPLEKKSSAEFGS